MKPGERIQGEKDSYVLATRLKGMTENFMANDSKGRQVIIKTPYEDDKLECHAYIREYTALSRIDHPGVIALEDINEDDERPFIATRYLPGQDFSTMLNERKKLSVKETTRLFSSICESLNAAHEQGVVHRDVKPQNVRIKGTGMPVVIDFGLSYHKSIESLDKGVTAIGSPFYMGPEHWNVNHPIFKKNVSDPRMDVYSLGIMLYRALIGEIPFIERTVDDTRYRHLFCEMPNATDKDKDIPIWLTDIILKSTAKIAGDRYQSTLALKEALESGSPKPRRWYHKIDAFAKLASVFL